MKNFFLGLGFCFRPADSSHAGLEEKTEFPISADQTPVGHKGSPKNLRYKRGSPSSLSAGAADWKPSLCSISEDDVVVMVAAAAEKVRWQRQTVASEGFGRRERGSLAGDRIVPSTDNSNLRKSPIPMVIPAFAGAPFFL